MSSNLGKTLDYESIAELLESLEKAGWRVKDLERVVAHPHAARAALLAARNSRSQEILEILPTVLDRDQIQAILIHAKVPDDFMKKYREPTSFACLIADNNKVGPRGLDMLAMYLGVLPKGSKPITLYEVASHYNLSRERVRQITHTIVVELRRLAADERPRIVDQVTKGKLNNEQTELLTLLDKR